MKFEGLPPEYYVKSIRYAGREADMAKLDLTGEDELEIVLAQSAVTIQGRVVNAGGQPAGEAVIALVQAADSRPFRTGQADGLGHFYFGNLPPGSYRVYAWNASIPGAEAEDPLTTGGKTVPAHGNEEPSLTVVVSP